MYRVKTIVIMLVMILMAGSCWATPSIQQVGKKAKIDWTNNVYIATGEGVIPTAKEEPNRARAFLKAKGYARMAAIANLLMAIKGTTVTYEATGKDYMADEKIAQKIEGYVDNVQVTSVKKEKFEGDIIVIVEVRAPMFGQDTPGSIFLKAESEEIQTPNEEPVRVITKPDIKLFETEIPDAEASQPDKPYTSLIIDTSGYKIDRCMSPKIRKLDGTEVWGTVKANFDFVQDHGIVSYATSLAEAKKNARCGGNPLMIRAIGRAGGKFYSDPIISDANAELLLSENTKSGFLDKFNVIFIKDTPAK